MKLVCATKGSQLNCEGKSAGMFSLDLCVVYSTPLAGRAVYQVWPVFSPLLLNVGRGFFFYFDLSVSSRFPIQRRHVARLERCVMCLIPGLWREEQRHQEWKQQQYVNISYANATCCVSIKHQMLLSSGILAVCVHLGQPPGLPLIGRYGRQRPPVAEA